MNQEKTTDDILTLLQGVLGADQSTEEAQASWKYVLWQVPYSLDTLSPFR